MNPAQQEQTDEYRAYYDLVKSCTDLDPDFEAEISRGIRYYDLQRYWTRKIIPHLSDPLLNTILVHDFNRFTFGRWGQEFKLGDLPERFESCDWRFEHRWPYPRYWSYVKHGACHWIANFALRLAMLVAPNRPWRLLTSIAHTTVWDGKQTLFDFNFQAMGISAEECFGLARQDGEEWPPGAYHDPAFALHHTMEWPKPGDLTQDFA